MADQVKDTNQEELDENLVMLEDEEGNEIAFHYITTIEHEGKDYVYLQAANDSEDDEEVALEIYELEELEEDGEKFDSLLPVDDELYEVLYTKLIDALKEHDEEGCGCGCGDGDSCDCNK